MRALPRAPRDPSRRRTKDSYTTAMAEKYPEDQFDSAPENLLRVGAHRAPRRRGRGWIGFGWAVLATAILVAAGVFGLNAINGDIHVPGGFFGSAASGTPTASSTPTPTITPIVNGKLNVTVLNGTSVEGLATKVGDTLVAAGWKVDSRTNASQSDIKQTTVYYSDTANEAAALGMVKSLSGAKATAVLTQSFVDTGADLTVVVGSDYASSAP